MGLTLCNSLEVKQDYVRLLCIKAPSVGDLQKEISRESLCIKEYIWDENFYYIGKKKKGIYSQLPDKRTKQRLKDHEDLQHLFSAKTQSI